MVSWSANVRSNFFYLTSSLSLCLALALTFPVWAQQSIDIRGNNNTAIQIIIEMSQGDPNWLRTNEERIGKLAERLGVSNALIVSFLAKVDQSEVNREKWPEVLSSVAETYKQFQAKAKLLEANDPIAKDLVERARKAAENAQFDEADRLLIEAERQEAKAEEELDSARKKRRSNRVTIVAIRGEAYAMQLKHLDAAQNFEEAARLSEIVSDQLQNDMLFLTAISYHAAGNDLTRNDFALIRAITLYQQIIPDRRSAPLDWADIQNRLGNALRTLGGNENSKVRLEEAVAAHRAALEVRARERVPLDWATTQNDLGTALRMLGERESGTTRLEEAVAAFRAALEEKTQERFILDWVLIQRNLGTTLTELANRAGVAEKRIKWLKEAVAVHRAVNMETALVHAPTLSMLNQNGLSKAARMLGEIEGDKHLLQEADWADRAIWRSQWHRVRILSNWAENATSYGIFLHTLAQRENAALQLEEAVALFRSELKKRPRERDPLGWAAIQNNLGNALSILGQYQIETASGLSERESGLEQLKEAVAAYRVALEEMARDRVPLDWAATQSNLGNTLRIIGECEKRRSWLLQAAAAYSAALKEYTIDKDSFVWRELSSFRRETVALLRDPGISE